MPINYTVADRVLEISFEQLDRSNRMAFPAVGSLSNEINSLIDQGAGTVLTPVKRQLLASAGVEMWHRAIHSFLWSVVLTQASPLWASVTGYYASHFAMRAFSHSLGFFKSFQKRKAVQLLPQGGHLVADEIERPGGEHAFYWKIVKGHPTFAANPLFRLNSERDLHSDSAHRTLANYSDHVNSFRAIKFPEVDSVSQYVQKLSRIRWYSVTEPSREDYPDLQNVQILAFQRIVAFNDFLDGRVPRNRFWLTHRRPNWCENVMLFQVEDSGIEAPA